MRSRRETTRLPLVVASGDRRRGELRRWVRERVRAAAPGGRGMGFEISEDLPPNWREALPVVLEALWKDGTCQ